MIKLIYPIIFLLLILQSCKGQINPVSDKIDTSSTANHIIEKIEYATSMCYGTCPVFSLTINSDRKAEWNAEKYNKINDQEVHGIFHSEITKEQYNKLIDLLNYIDFEKLNDVYEVGYPDAQSSTLKITYDHGKVKSIYDYGKKGTEDLRRVYQLLFDLRENQKWQKQL